MKIKNKYGFLWTASGLVLLGGLAYAFWASPFVDAAGPFSQFEKSRAIPAGLIGISGTLLIMVWGRLLLRKVGKKDGQAGIEK